jgi:hypothetical protein
MKKSLQGNGFPSPVYHHSPLFMPPFLWCDNVSTLALASNPVFHARTKHIAVDYHFIREKVLNGDILVKFISTLDQVADIFI